MSCFRTIFQRCKIPYYSSLFVFQLLEVIWEFSHVDCLPVSLIDQAVTSHLDILTQSQYTTDQIRNLYIDKCINDIRDGRWAVPAIRHLQSSLEAMLRQPYSKSHKVRVFHEVVSPTSLYR